MGSVQDNNRKPPMLHEKGIESQSQNKGDGPYRQSKFIICTLEMSVSHSTYPKVSERILYGELRNDVREIV